jgi:hypothetical protein
MDDWLHMSLSLVSAYTSALATLCEVFQAFRADRRRAAFLLVLAWVAFTRVARADATLTEALQQALPGMPPEVVQHLLQEKVILLSEADPRPPGEPAQVQALILFAKPERRVFQLLLQTARQTEYRPDLKRAEAVERFPDGEVDVQEMRIMLMRISYWLRYHWDPATGRISWELDPRFPNDLRVEDGSWQLEAVDADHTIGRLATRVDVGPELPSFLQELATRKNLPQTLEQCRRWIDSDGRYRP